LFNCATMCFIEERTLNAVDGEGWEGCGGGVLKPPGRTVENGPRELKWELDCSGASHCLPAYKEYKQIKEENSHALNKAPQFSQGITKNGKEDHC
jgi:hypothetical protein